jgi:YHS domain-containing protein
MINYSNFVKIFIMKYLLFFVATFFIVACGSNSESKTNTDATAETVTDTANAAMSATEEKNLTCSNKTCPQCSMELNGKCADTCMYEGKIIGFCSKECKEECMKDPKKEEKLAACCKKEAEEAKKKETK